MFPSQRGDEMVIEFSSCPHHQQQKMSEDLILDDYAHTSLDFLDFSHKKLQGRTDKPKKLLYESSDDKINYHYRNSENDYKKKNERLVHREIERQRRQEMATLHASLRSLLPLEFIKGKRSISDHMNEAKNYIKHLQKKIKELSAKRDELKRLSKNSSNPETLECEEYTCSGFFSIHEINTNGGVGIEVSSSFGEERLSLSKVLKLVLDEGLGVVNCVSTEVNGRLLHSVQCEVNSSDRVDLPALRRKIVNLVPSFKCRD
ncbi:transcription factor bHLH36-like [Prosopis cineraria]|uniref:transcription factor bHLH36-like n=1 Tax=Prosopis cineraria TaxID=364024 RepID=UPI0024103E60|nr:transcription factor bHLH36-like [Prosopis cineraria]